MDIEKLRRAVIDKRFILSANPDWRKGRFCGLTDDETEKKANDALGVILDSIGELVVAYLIDDRQSVKREDVQVEINRLKEVLTQTKEAAKELKEQKYTVNMLPVYNQIKSLELQIAALQEYQPWIPVSERMAIESDLRNGMVLAWSTELCEWQVENWGYVEDRPDDYTHWKPLPEPPKGETTCNIEKSQ